MRDFPKVLEAMPLGRDRVGVRVVDPTDHDDGVGQELDGLALGRRCSDGAGDGNGAAHGQMQDLVLVVGEGRRSNHLDGVEAGPVVDVQEREPGLRIAACPDPALDRRPRADRRPAGEDVRDSICVRHEVLLPASRSARCSAT
jgi:hypothetical protein